MPCAVQLRYTDISFLNFFFFCSVASCLSLHLSHLILVNYLQATVGCEETFSQVCSNLNNLSSEVREPNLLKTVNCYNYLDDLKRLVKSLPILENDLKLPVFLIW